MKKSRPKFELPDAAGVASRRFEEEIYEAVLEEVESGTRCPGLWAKALAKSEGDDLKARALYIDLRAQSMLDESWWAAQEWAP